MSNNKERFLEITQSVGKPILGLAVSFGAAVASNVLSAPVGVSIGVLALGIAITAYLTFKK